MGLMAPPPLSKQTSLCVRQSPLRRAGPEGRSGMGVDPVQYHLLEMGVIQAALSCFSGPPSRVCRFVLLKS